MCVLCFAQQERQCRLAQVMASHARYAVVSSMSSGSYAATWTGHATFCQFRACTAIMSSPSYIDGVRPQGISDGTLPQPLGTPGALTVEKDVSSSLDP